MGQQGELLFYSRNKLVDPRRVTLAVCALTGARRAFLTRAQEQPPGGGGRATGNDDEHSPTRSTTIRTIAAGDERIGRVDIEIVSTFVQDGTVLSADLGRTPLGVVTAEAIEHAIPKRVRGEVSLTDPILRIGWHELAREGSSSDAIDLPDRAYFSFALFGYGSPIDPLAYHDAVFRIPEVQQLRQHLEAITGPLERTVVWSA